MTTGWRAKIGLIHPYRGLSGYLEFNDVAPQGVQFLSAPLFFPMRTQGPEARRINWS